MFRSFFFTGLRPQKLSDYFILFSTAWAHLPPGRRNALTSIFLSMKKMQIIPQNLPLRQFLANYICYYAFKKRKNQVLAALQWRAGGTNYQNPDSCLHNDFSRNKEIAVEEAYAFVEQMIAKPPMDSDFWDGFFHALWDGFFDALEEKFLNDSSLLRCMVLEPKAEPKPEQDIVSKSWLKFLTGTTGEDGTLYD